MYTMFKKMLVHAAILLVCSLAFSAIASAHVTVFPNEATQGSYEKFTVRVPNEGKVPTVKVEVRFPLDSVAISRFEPKPGWTYELTRNAEDKITAVIWTATGEGLASTEFGEFNMQGKVTDTATQIVWKAYQTYKDGAVVEWTGAEGADKPASVTKVNAKPAGTTTDSHGHSAAAGGASAADEHSSSSSNTPLYLSIVAVILGAASLLVSLTRKKA